MDGLTHLRQTLSNAYLVLTDIHLLLRPLVGLGTSPQFDPTTLLLLSLSLLAISYYDVTFAAGLLAMANSTQSLKPDPLV